MATCVRVRDAEACGDMDRFELLIVGDELLTGKRRDSHLTAVIERLRVRSCRYRTGPAGRKATFPPEASPPACSHQASSLIE